LDLVKLDKDDYQEYDKLVEGSHEGSFFHKSWWLECMERNYGMDVPIYGLFESDELVSAMPIPTRKVAGMTWIYPPYITPYMGPVFANKEYKREYKLNSWKKRIKCLYAKKLGNIGRCLYYPFLYNVKDIMPFEWEGYRSGVSYTYLLDVSNLETVWENMDRSNKKHIKANQNNGIKIREGTCEELYVCLSNSMNRKGHPCLGEKVLEDIVKVCCGHDCGRIFSADIDEKLLGCILLVYDEKRSYGLSCGRTDDSHNATTSLFWECFKYTNEVLKLDTYDFEGSCHSSIEPFFRSFNGQLVPYYYIEIDNPIYGMAQKAIRKFNSMRNPKRY